MKRTLLCLMPCLLLLIALFAGGGQDMNISPAEQAVNKILADAAKVIEKHDRLRPAGAGVAMPGGNVKRFHLSFCSRAPYSREYLRELLISSAQVLLDQVNASEDVRPYLIKYPFTESEIDIVIFNSYQDGTEVIAPGIALADFSGGSFIYRTVESDQSFGYKNTYRETLEEARAILKKNQPPAE